MRKNNGKFQFRGHESETILFLKGNDELLSVNMNALVGILRQLSSLSKHAESLFADLFNEVSMKHISLLIVDVVSLSSLFCFCSVMIRSNQCTLYSY